jgi:hypothetical protein
MFGVLAPEWLLRELSDSDFETILALELVPADESVDGLAWFRFIVDEFLRNAPGRLVEFIDCKSDYLATAILEVTSASEQVARLSSRLGTTSDTRIQLVVLERLWSCSVKPDVDVTLNDLVLRAISSEDGGIRGIAALLEWKYSTTADWDAVVNALDKENESFQEMVLDEADGLNHRFGEPTPAVVKAVRRLAASSPSANAKMAAQWALDHWNV